MPRDRTSRKSPRAPRSRSAERSEGAGSRGARGGPSHLRTCFVAGTLVRVRDGYRPIEEIRSGDTVRAYNEETGEIVWAKVTETFVRTANEIHTVALENGERIQTTWSHRFYVIRVGNRYAGSRSSVRGEWVEARSLRTGDALVLEDGRTIRIASLTVESRTERVYNFSVEGAHTYFVSRTGVLVHNEGGCDVVFWDLNPDSIMAEMLRPLSRSELARGMRSATADPGRGASGLELLGGAACWMHGGAEACLALDLIADLLERDYSTATARISIVGAVGLIMPLFRGPTGRAIGPPLRRVLPEIPRGWSAELSRNGQGVVFRDPLNRHNSIRIMRGDPLAQYAHQRVPYVRVNRNGRPVDASGRILRSDRTPEAHIPLDEFADQIDNFIRLFE